MLQEEYLFLRNVLRSQGIDMHAFYVPFLDLEKFDKGLRRQLYLDYDYQMISQCLQSNCKVGYIYSARDVFDVQYAILVGESIGEDGVGTPEKAMPVYLVAGPYLNQSARPDAGEIAERNHLELYHMSFLKEYYNTLPMVRDIEPMIYNFLQYFVKNRVFQVDTLKLELGEQSRDLIIGLEKENDLSLKLIEKRYRSEEKLLQAIGEGNQTKAFLAMGEMGRYGIEGRSRDQFRDKQNMMLTLNVLFRKAVQNARVHPFHIDAVSGSFAKRIEISRTEVELRKISSEMVKKYCRLVKSYSLKGYSSLVEDVINYIEFNLQEPLGMGRIAEEFSVNASYLSGQFKRETKETLTNYLNQKRIEKSLLLLATTKLSVQEVAARVGIYDENYFSRLFKKMQNITPRQYRNSIRKK